MITRVTGILNRVMDEEVRLQIGAFEYQVLVPEFVRRQLQLRLGEEIRFHTNEYLEGNPMQSRVVPRMIGFLSEEELEFFELFCTVDKVGVRKALKALMQPIRDIADAIQRQDTKWLTSLPGIGPATADQIVTTLKKKVMKFALLAPSATPRDGKPASIEGRVLDDAYQALLSVGHAPAEARNKLDKLMSSGKTYASVEDVLLEIYRTAG